jgi:hypothetical protein
MSTVDMLQPQSAPARAYKGHRLHWFRLVVVVLVLIRILAALPRLAWARLAVSRKPTGEPNDR